MPPDELPAGRAAPAAGSDAAPAPAPAAAAADAAPAPAAAPPAAPAAPPAAIPAAPVAAAAPAADKPATAAPNEFAPSLLDEAAKTPTPEPKAADAAPIADAAKPADGKAPAIKEPAADAAKTAEAAKAAEAAKPPEPPAPIEYAFTREEAGERRALKPDEYNAETLGAFAGLLNEARVAPEAAQKMFDLHLAETARIAKEVTDRVVQNQWNVFQEQQIKSRQEVMADPVLGGSRSETAMRTVMSAIDEFLMRDQKTNPRSADQIAAERREMMDDFRATGIANRRSLLSFMHWVGDKFVREGKPRPAPPPRGASPNGAQRGTGRYRNTTPAQAGG